MVDEKQEKLTEMVEDFCDEYLNDEHKQMSLKLIDLMLMREVFLLKEEELKYGLVQ